MIYISFMNLKFESMIFAGFNACGILTRFGYMFYVQHQPYCKRSRFNEIIVIVSKKKEICLKGLEDRVFILYFTYKLSIMSARDTGSIGILKGKKKERQRVHS